MRISHTFCSFSLLSLGALSTPCGAQPLTPNYLATVQFAVVQEISPEMIARDQIRIQHQLKLMLDTIPSLHQPQYHIQTQGNEVLLYMVTERDVHVPMQQAMAELVQSFHGNIPLRGRLHFSSLSPPVGQYQVEMGEGIANSQVLRIQAQEAPLRDLLKDLKKRISGFSYFVPSGCANSRLTFEFSHAALNRPTPSVKENLDDVMRILSENTGLQVKRQKANYYVFSGECEKRELLPMSHPLVLDQHSFQEITDLPQAPAPYRQVVYPISPLSE